MGNGMVNAPDMFSDFDAHKVDFIEVDNGVVMCAEDQEKKGIWEEVCLR